MPAAGLSPIGLMMAAACSVTNVLTDVGRKHALSGRDLIPTTFWIRTVVASISGLVLLWRVLVAGAPLAIRDGATGSFFGFLLLDVLLISVVTLLYFRALQISPMSLCIPFLAFTPVFLIPVGYFMLGEAPSPLKAVGVILIVVGSLAMHRKLFAEGWLAPAKAVIRERGSRYMLLVSLLFSFTNTLDKKLVTMSDVFIEAFAYGTGLAIAFLIMSLVRGGDFRAASRDNWKWISMAGLMDAVSLLFQLGSYTYIAVVITVSIKRAGIILSVFSGWLFFREREITDKAIAASVMFCGVLVLYLPVDATEAGAIAVATIAGMFLALYLTREKKHVTEA
jgi:drug/metabolite transporter (DMT)-like permease